MTKVNLFQEKFGTPGKGAAGKVVPYMVDWVQNFIRLSPFVILASSSDDGRSCRKSSYVHPEPSFASRLNSML